MRQRTVTEQIHASRSRQERIPDVGKLRAEAHAKLDGLCEEHAARIAGDDYYAGLVERLRSQIDRSDPTELGNAFATVRGELGRPSMPERQRQERDQIDRYYAERVVRALGADPELRAELVALLRDELLSTS